jgi:GH25 family lysozyme M1 (1,4-beta-N-acetylmuramidase)
VTGFHRPGRSRLVARLAVAMLVLAGSTGVGATEALAAPSPAGGGTVGADPAASGITHPDRDFMGWSRRGTQGPSTGAPRTDAVTFAVTQTPGIDVSHWNGTVNWASRFASGIRFAWIKATEGVTFRDPAFGTNYVNAYRAGVIRGAYHFALPDRSSGATQANFLASHGGAWSRDGRTLPATLDIEYNPYGSTCYGKSRTSMSAWIRDFVRTYKARTGRDAVIYTTTDWWRTCTGNDSTFGRTNPLWIARYASTPGTLPAGWSVRTVWQWTSTPLDQDRFNGALDRVRALALG